MLTPEFKTFYVMDMLDHSDLPWAPPGTLYFDKIATEAYGRLYVGQQTGDMLPNDSIHEFDMSDPEEVPEWLTTIEHDDYVREAIEKYVGYTPTYSLEGWLALPDEKYGFQHYRKGPTPMSMLAHLITDGHLPYGHYLLRVSW